MLTIWEMFFSAQTSENFCHYSLPDSPMHHAVFLKYGLSDIHRSDYLRS